MDFETGHIYHIFNQGNNHQKLFFDTENYLFFLKKINNYILPYADILAWCLMPNHFHLMVYLHTLEITIDDSEGITNQETQETHRVTWSHPVSKTQSINQSIAIMLRSYTRAINKQKNKSGSLFREGTKAQCLTQTKGVTPSFYNTEFGAQINIPQSEKEYPQLCFNYIHNNPVKGNLVLQPEDWEFSSYRDYCGMRKGKLINRSRAEEFGLHL